ncbi:hypothetical protein NEIG_02064 [Nematocida sp. ERTm5]|nr:hypothetical protein NEIG_02064 [Nematocida sp. ERTm5]
MRTAADVDRTIKQMDTKYDANFGEWVRSEDNLDVLGINLKKYVIKYSPELFTEVLNWITDGWSTTSKILLMHRIFKNIMFENNTHSVINNNYNTMCNNNTLNSTHSVINNRLNSTHSVINNECNRLVIHPLHRVVRILKGVTENWRVQEIAELLIEFITEMKKEEKRLFLLWMLEDIPSDKLTEIFIRIDGAIDWALKISIIKNSKERM